jgi:DNA-binding transcriptional LysR family regulator
MDQLRAMRVFVKVVDEGGFAAAARSLDLAPAVVTRLLIELEEHLGVRLLNRTTRRIALTDAGAQYLDSARQLLADLEDADLRVSAASSEPRGLLRLLAPPAFTVHQLAKHLPGFRAQYPHIHIELTVPGPVETVDENFDLSIVMVRDPLVGGDFVARLIARSEIVLCAAPSYLERRGHPKRPGDLAHHDNLLPNLASLKREVNFINTDAAQSAGKRSADSERVVSVKPVRPVLSTTHVDTAYAAALAGLGIAGLPSFVAEDALTEHALERVLPTWRLFDTHLYAALPTRKHVPARTRAMLDFLVQTFGGESNDPWLRAAGCATQATA